MFSDALPSTAYAREASITTIAYGEQPHIGTSLKRGLDRLTRVFERKIDRQVLAAQIRAYDTSSTTPASS
ncbi:hypothetical protein ACN47E_008217 [Coniothyrium glycines]